eukprot:m.338114 g.338114  ORF g.338114 m.338114 type:complete len:1030 (-) comp18317_c0_seq1:150-3239(-)
MQTTNTSGPDPPSNENNMQDGRAAAKKQRDGAVKVAVRTRPFNSREKSLGAKSIVQIVDNQTVLHNPKNEEDMKTFTFDYSYNSFSSDGDDFTSQEKIFRDLGDDVVSSAYAGYNACVLAYGQTGAGKTYSMIGGPDEERGLIPRICEALFERQDNDSGTKYSAEVSFLEIYNEKVRDLLVFHESPKKKKSAMHTLRVRENPQTGPYVEGLQKHTVKSADEILRLMSVGTRNRTVAATAMNDTSSRSHALFTVKFTQASFLHGIPAEKSSQLNLVDLAGSERTSSTGAQGLRLKEGGSINKSLTTLGIVINQLAKTTRSQHIPYRDSVLTWLLRESLGGNSKTIMLAAISPADVNYGESLSTLHYANRAKNIVNKPVVNEDDNVRIIRELREEVDSLKAKLGEKAASGELAAQIEQSEQLVSQLTDKWTNKWEVTTRMMEERELKLEEDGVSVRMESERPHLVSLNLDDPLASGVVLHYLKDGITTMGTETSDIILTGEGAREKHCEIEFTKEDGVILIPKEGTCLLNAKAVLTRTSLVQGSTLIAGNDNIFRFNHPIQARMLREKRSRGELDDKSISGAMSPYDLKSKLLAENMSNEDMSTLQFKLLELQVEKNNPHKSVVSSPDASSPEEINWSPLESLHEDLFAQHIAVWLSIDDLVMLRLCSHRLCDLVDSLLPIKIAWNGWAALLREDTFNPDAVMHRLCFFPEPVSTHEEIHKRFKGLCAECSVEVVSKFVEINALTGNDVLENEAAAFRVVCKNGNLDLAVWLADEFDLTADVARIRDNYALGEACRLGHTRMVAWLVDRFHLGLQDIRDDDNYALRMACAHGHLDILRWMLSEFSLTSADSRTDDAAPLRLACHMGHLEVAQMLVAHFGLDVNDLRRSGNYALFNSSAEGHVDIVRWLLHKGLGRQDILDRGGGQGHSPFVEACRKGNLEIAQLLAHAANLDEHDIKARSNEVFRVTCAEGQQEVVEWIVGTFGLTIEDARSMENQAIRVCYRNGHLDLMKWLVVRFSMTPEDAASVQAVL